MPGMLPQWAVILIIVLAVVIVIIYVVAGTIFIVTLLSRSRWVGSLSLLGRTRWVGSLSHCLADQGGWGHFHTARQIKVGGVTQCHCSADQCGWGHCHTARQIKVGGVTHTVTAWQIKVGGVIFTLLGRSRWVGSHIVSHCSADQGGLGHMITSSPLPNLTPISVFACCKRPKTGWLKGLGSKRHATCSFHGNRSHYSS